MFEMVLENFIALWAVIDPIGTIPVFIVATSQCDSKLRRIIAVKATVIAAGLLLFFIVGGQFLLEALNIPLSAFQIAGGIILLLFALTMVFGESKPESEITELETSPEEMGTAVFPLAVPSIASPAAMMTVVLLTDNHRFAITEQMVTTSVVLAVLLITLLLMLLANGVNKLIGRQGASIVSRVMGLILASVAVNNVLEGIKTYFSI